MLGACVVKGPEWVERCSIVHSLVPTMCDEGCPFLPGRVMLTRIPTGDRRPDPAHSIEPPPQRP